MKYDWIATRERLNMVTNQHPDWPSPSFDNWVREGWEIVSITPMNMDFAIGVLRKPAADADTKFTGGSREALCAHCGKTFCQHSNFDASCKATGATGGETK